MNNILLNSQYYETWSTYARLAVNTKRGYTTALRKFGAFIKEKGMTGDLDFDHFYEDPDSGETRGIDRAFIDDFVQDLKETGASDNTLYLSITALNSFMEFLAGAKMIKSNPLRYYHNPYYRPNLSNRSLSKKEVEILLKSALELDPFLKQYYVLIRVMVHIGLRASEIRALRRSRIDLERKTILINEGQKTIAAGVHIPSSLADELERYLNHPLWLEWSDGQDKEVFWKDGHPLSYYDLRKILDAVAQNSGTGLKVRPHDFRHTMARLLSEANVPLPAIQRGLRHVRMETALRYLPFDSRMRDVVEMNSQRLLGKRGKR